MLECKHNEPAYPAGRSRERKRREGMRGRSAGALAALSLALLLLAGCSEREEPQRVRLWALAPPEVTVVEGGGPAPLRLAVALTISPQEGYHLYGDLAEALGQKIGRHVHLILRRTFSEVNDLARSRQAEAVHLCSRGFLQGLTDFGLTAIAVPVVTGRTRHPSYVIVSAESEIGSPGELKGKTFAFADPLCAPEPFPTGRGAPPPDGFFKRRLAITSHDRAIRAVAEGMVAGALVDGLTYRRLALAAPGQIATTKPIGETGPYMNPPIAVHPGLDPSVRRELERALLTLHEGQAGRAVLARLGIERFAAPVNEGDPRG